MFALECDRAHLYSHPERDLTSQELVRFNEALTRRREGCPIQYITGHQEFWGLDFLVTPAVLIPRPETEHLIESALPRAKQIAHARIVDVGTGSGCIAITLAKELPDAEISATDISSSALSLARENAQRLGVANRIQFYERDLLAGFPAASFDLVISNPPYVGESEEDAVQLEVLKFEPRHAVFAGPSGTEIIERLIPQAQVALTPGSWLLMEISGTISPKVKTLLCDWDEVRITNDLQGIPRIAAARKPTNGPATPSGDAYQSELCCSLPQREPQSRITAPSRPSSECAGLRANACPRKPTARCEH